MVRWVVLGLLLVIGLEKSFSSSFSFFSCLDKGVVWLRREVWSSDVERIAIEFSRYQSCQMPVK